MKLVDAAAHQIPDLLGGDIGGNLGPLLGIVVQSLETRIEPAGRQKLVDRPVRVAPTQVRCDAVVNGVSWIIRRTADSVGALVEPPAP